MCLMFKLGCLQRYVLKTWLAPFVGILVLVTLILLLKQVLFWLPTLIENDVPFWLSSKLFFAFVPGILVMAIPLSYFFAVYRSVKTFQSNSELDALYAGGLSLFQVFKPVFWVGIGLSLLLLWFTMNVVPDSKLGIYNTNQQLAARHASPSFTPQRFADVEDITFYSEGKNSDGIYVRVMIADARENKLSPTLYFAETANIQKGDDGIYIILEHGNQLSGAKQKLQMTNFESYQIQIPMLFERGFNTLSATANYAYMHTKALYERMQAENTIQSLAEWNRRFIPPLSLLILFFIAIPLSLQAKRSQKGGTFLLAITAIAIMETSQLILFRKITAGIAPWWSTWALEAVYASIAIFLFMQVNKYGSLSMKRILPVMAKQAK